MRDHNSRTEHARDPLHLRATLRSTTVLTGLALIVVLVARSAQAEEIWTGAVSSDWFTGGNWADGSVPTAADDVVLNETTPNFTRIGPGVANANYLTIGAASRLGTLQVHSGGDLITGAGGTIGRTSLGTATITGTGSTWNSRSLKVGDYAQGMLSIENGGAVSSGVTYLGYNAQGDATVTGLDSRWTITDIFTVGGGFPWVTGNGGLFIKDQGTVASVNTILGKGDGSFGAVAVTGAGSAWTNSGYLFIGEHGTGTLTIEADGDVTTDGNASVGRDSDGAGTATVTGLGSTWTTNGFLRIGDLTGSEGSLTISNQGTVVSNSQVRLGDAPGAQGAALVTGAGSKWIGPATQFHVGFGGEGSLTIDDGGEVQSRFTTLGERGSGTAAVMSGAAWTISDDFKIGGHGAGALRIENGGTVNSIDSMIGAEVDGAGVVTVTGGGSIWTNTGDLFVGDEGFGSVTVADGGAINSGGVYLARTADATGAATVTGSGSIWNSGGLYVGENGEATLTIANGGVVHSGHGDVGVYSDGVGFATVTGDESIWTTTNLTVGEYGVGTLLIEDGGLVTHSAAASIGSETTGVGTVTVTGNRSKWVGSGDLFVGRSGQGMLTIEDGAEVNPDETFIADQPGSFGTVTVAGMDSELVTIGISVGERGAGSLVITDGGVVRNLGAIIGRFAGSEGKALVTSTDTLWRPESSLWVGNEGSGKLTVADHAVIETDEIRVAALAGSQGTVNIGAAASGASAAPGTLNTPLVQFGAGDGSLVFNHTAQNYLFAPQIDGTGAIEALSGTTSLSANSSTFTGSTTIHDGAALSIDGSIGGTLDVLAGGRLKGSGTVGFTTVAGTVAPGNSIGTLHVAGNYTQAAGSTYEVEFDAAGNSDRIDVTGTATLNGGTVEVVPLPDFALARPYTILTAAGGVTGTFDEAAMGFSSAFLTPRLSYDTNNVTFAIAQTASFASAALTSNQEAAAEGADSLAVGNTVWDAIALLPSASDAPAAFDALSGEVHASAKNVFIEDSRFVREAIDARLRAAFAGVGADFAPVLAYGDDGPEIAPADTGRFAAWGHAFGSWGAWDSDGNAASLTRDTGGFMLGGDIAVADIWRLGLLAGYSSSSFDIDDRASSGSTDSYHLGAYAGAEIGKWGLRLGGAYSWHDVDTARTAAFPGFTDTLSAGYGAATAQIFGEAGYRIDTAHARFEPFAHLAYVNLRTDGFTESGGPAALTASSSSQDTLFTTLGLRAETALTLGGTSARMHGMLGWRHAFGDVTPTSNAAFTGSTAFTIAGVPIAEDVAVIEAGLNLALSPTANLNIAYNGQINGGASDHGLKANLMVKF